MKFLDLVQKRSSVRAFEPRPVEKEKLDYLLEAARMAPSAVNFQPWKLIVVTGDGIQQLQESYPREWFSSAPLCIVVCGDHRKSWKRSSDEKDYCDVDVAIASTHLMLAAAEQELGTCFVCNFDVSKCRAALSLPKHLEPIAMIPVGYSKPDANEETEKIRKPLDEIVEYK
jgi:nitroreductase